MRFATPFVAKSASLYPMPCRRRPAILPLGGIAVKPIVRLGHRSNPSAAVATFRQILKCQRAQTRPPRIATLPPDLRQPNGGSDAFVAKLSPSGSALTYSTYLGGSGYPADSQGIAVDGSGSAYVTGEAASTDFPTHSGLQAANGGPSFDAFVAKLNPAGSALSYSTYLGGSDQEAGRGITVDGSGSAYVIRDTSSSDFPTYSPLQPAYGGGTRNAFVAKRNAAGSASYDSHYPDSFDNDGCRYGTIRSSASTPLRPAGQRRRDRIGVSSWRRSRPPRPLRISRVFPRQVD